MSRGERTIQRLSDLLLRQLVLLTLVAVLAALLLGMTVAAYRGLLNEHEDKIEFHFSRLKGGTSELEQFVTLWKAERSAIPAPIADESEFHQLRTFHSGDLQVRELRHRASSVSFFVANEAGQLGFLQQHPFGANLADFYASFWAFSPYPAPQCMLLTDHSRTSLVVPAPRSSDEAVIARQDIAAVLEETRGLLADRSEGVDWGSGGHWFRMQYADDASSSLLLYVAKVQKRIDYAEPGGEKTGSTTSVGANWIACALSAARVNDYEFVLGEAFYDRISLFSPAGERLVGLDDDVGRFREGRNYTRDGLVYKFASRDGGWSAVYHIGYGLLLHQSRWLLLGILVAPMLLAMVGFLVYHWYRKNVVAPATIAHNQLVESEAFNRDLINHAPVGVCLLRYPDGEVLLVNPSAETLLGSSAGKPAGFYEWGSFALRSRASGEPHGQHAFAMEDGRHLLMNCSFSQFRGDPVILCMFVDITPRHQVEQALVHAKQLADDASNAKSMFLATISHEIRTPLYGVLGTLELLSRTRLDNKQQQHLLTIQRASSTLMLLMSDILDVTKIESGQLLLEPVEMSPVGLTEEVVRSYAASAMRKGLQIYSCIDPGVPDTVTADAARIRQILNNLLSNAIKFTEMGRVVMRLKAFELTPGRWSLLWQVSDTGVGIARLEQERLFEPFYQANPRYGTGHGTGLGLSICARLAQMMDGRISVVSEERLGSSFSFQLDLEGRMRRQPDQALPFDRAVRIQVRSVARELAENLCLWLNALGADAQLFNPQTYAADALVLDLSLDGVAHPREGLHVTATLDGPDHPVLQNGMWVTSLLSRDAILLAVRIALGAVDPHVASTQEPTFTALGLQVLVAEDNPINQYILRGQLEQLGCFPVVAADGVEALNYWDSQRFDVVMTDINMPHMNGYELTRQLRGRGASVPIIGATANASPEEEFKCTTAGMDARLVKPISLSALYEQLKGATGPSAEALLPGGGETMAGPEDVDALIIPSKMLNLFRTTMDEDIERLRKALSAGTREQVALQLHRVMGALAIGGATSLVETCRQLEGDLRGGATLDSRKKGISSFLLDLERALARLGADPSEPGSP